MRAFLIPVIVALGLLAGCTLTDYDRGYMAGYDTGQQVFSAGDALGPELPKSEGASADYERGYKDGHADGLFEGHDYNSGGPDSAF